MVALPSRSQTKRRIACEILAIDDESFEREIFAGGLRSDPIYSISELCAKEIGPF